MENKCLKDVTDYLKQLSFNNNSDDKCDVMMRSLYQKINYSNKSNLSAYDCGLLLGYLIDQAFHDAEILRYFGMNREWNQSPNNFQDRDSCIAFLSVIINWSENRIRDPRVSAFKRIGDPSDFLQIDTQIKLITVNLYKRNHSLHYVTDEIFKNFLYTLNHNGQKFKDKVHGDFPEDKPITPYELLGIFTQYTENITELPCPILHWIRTAFDCIQNFYDGHGSGKLELHHDSGWIIYVKENNAYEG